MPTGLRSCKSHMDSLVWLWTPATTMPRNPCETYKTAALLVQVLTSLWNAETC